MAEVAMTRYELIEFVVKNFLPEDFGWVDEDFHDDCIDRKHLVDFVPDLTTSEIVDSMFDPDQFVRDAAEHLGMVVSDMRNWEVEAFHDDNGHQGAIAYCPHPLCSNY